MSGDALAELRQAKRGRVAERGLVDGPRHRVANPARRARRRLADFEMQHIGAHRGALLREPVHLHREER